MKKIAVLFSTAIILSAVALPSAVLAVDIDEQIQQTESQLNDIKNSEAAVEAELARISVELQTLEQRAQTVQSDIAAGRDRLAALEVEISALNEKITLRTEKIAEQAQTLQVTGGEINYFQILASATSISDVFARYQAANDFMHAGQLLRDQQVADMNAVKDKRAEVEATIAKSHDDAYQLENLKEQVYQKQLEQTIYASELSAQRASVEADRAGFIAQKEAAERELAAAQAASEQHVRTVVESAVTTVVSNPAATSTPAVQQATPAAPVVASTQPAPATVATPAPAQQPAPAPVQAAPAAPAASTTGSAVSIAQQYLGVPYAWGGSSPSGFDCSGLVQYVYRQLGVSLPRTTYSQEYAGTRIAVSEAQPGDLIFWGSPGSTYHVAIYMGGGRFIHAPSEGGAVEILSISPYWAPSFAVRL